MQVKKSLKNLKLRCIIFSGGILNHDNQGEYYHFSVGRLPGPYIIRDVFQNLGVQTEVIDMVQSWPEKWLHKWLDKKSKEKIDIICISTTFMENSYLIKLSGILNKYFPHALTVVGSGNPGVITNRFINYHIYSYGENAVEPMLRHHYFGEPLKFEQRGTTKFINALHDYPAWPKDDYSWYFKDLDCVDHRTVGTLEMSRGCRFKCSFCNFPLIGLKEDTSQKELNNQINALNKNYHHHGITQYFIADDTFNDRTEKIEKLAKIVEKLDFTPDFTAFMRLDLLWSKREQWDLLKPARLLSHHYGIETFNVEAAKTIGKGKQAEIGKETLLELQNYFATTNPKDAYIAFATFIIGLPYETKESILDTAKWLNENWTRGDYNFYNLEINSGSEVLSAFDKNLSKYGYETVDNKKLPFVLAKRGNTVYWKNEHMDAKEAYDLAVKLNNERAKNVKNAWGMRNSKGDPKKVLEDYIKKKFDKLYGLV